MVNIGRNIKERREHEGLDQSELADRVCVTQSYISYIEKGKKLPSVPLLTDIARVLHCTIDELVRDKVV